MHLHLFVNAFQFHMLDIRSRRFKLQTIAILDHSTQGLRFRDLGNSFGGAFLDPPDPSTFHTRAYSVSRGLKRMQPSNDSDSHALYSQPPCGYCVRKGKIRAALDRRAIREVTEVVIKKKKRDECIR